MRSEDLLSRMMFRALAIASSFCLYGLEAEAFLVRLRKFHPRPKQDQAR
jgi:hypothetical protein